MLDFLMVSTKSTKKGVTEIFPKFIIPTKGTSTDLMIRGGDFYAVWDETDGLWSTSEEHALYLIDYEIDKYVEEHKNDFGDDHLKVLHMWDGDSGMIDKWHKYVQKQMRDSWHLLDSKVIFSNTKTKKRDYASKKLPYPIEDVPTPAYDQMMETLYSPEERKKIEWAVGSIACGESSKIQKFIVMYGAPATGKSTVLNIIQDLFEGYYSAFDAKSLGNPNSTFALEPFKTNPLVAIQQDGDLSRIEDNTRLNSIVSHELMTVNEKFKSTYSNRFQCFLFMGTNKPVKITDAKSGIIRRLIDVSPTGNKLPRATYEKLKNQISYEHGGIVSKCMKVFKDNPGAYDDYVPSSMLGASNDFYNYVLENYDIFSQADSTTLKAAWELYKSYCDYAKVPYSYSQRVFKEELKNYFDIFKEREVLEDGSRVRNVYKGFIFDKFLAKPEVKALTPEVFKLTKKKSLLDDILAECPAQYANTEGTPNYKWANVTTKLKDISTSELHYVKVPENHIVIDFDLKDENGEKSYELNAEAASKWPETYAELSKGGQGIHLHYIYNGDVSMLSREFAKDIEIKVFNGNSSLRRKLTKCNDIPVATISSGLPQKEKKVINPFVIKTEKALRKQIINGLTRKVWPNTKPSVDYIYKVLTDAYNDGLVYDVSDLKNDVMRFAMGSSHNAQYCMDLVDKMPFRSEEKTELNSGEYESDQIIIFDMEVKPNMNLICWKALDKGTVQAKVNPSPQYIKDLCKFKLIGFNNLGYDNHILWAIMQEYTPPMVYDISNRIIAGDPSAKFREARNLSYTDIYDFSSVKQSLKKFEIQMKIPHKEMDLPWDKPIEEKDIPKMIEYCKNDVLATEAVFKARQGDFLARQILADIAGGTVNDTTNTLTTKLIFGNERKPQGTFAYRNLAEPVFSLEPDMKSFLQTNYPDILKAPHGPKKSLLPYFEGYTYEKGVSTYMGEKIGEGGLVRAVPGMYANVVTFDVASEHPNSAASEYAFGHYTKLFYDLMKARVAIKHGDFDSAAQMFDGKLAKHLTNKDSAKQLAGALKIAINSVYGLTAAKFDNPFRDPRNVDNIVAKRGALFMMDLRKAATDRGMQVIHIKTDSIKIVNPSAEDEAFVMEFGKRYGYSFEIEHKFEKICLVNDAVYIAKLADDDPDHPGQWTATGAQFQHPYVFKKLFSKEDILFEDLCETKSVTSAIYLDMNEDIPEGEHRYQFIGKVGLFCPMKPGTGGGLLLRAKGGEDDGYSSVTGTKGYRWMESDMVKALGKEADIDYGYFDALANDAMEAVSKYGDFEWFANEND